MPRPTWAEQRVRRAKAQGALPSRQEQVENEKGVTTAIRCRCCNQTIASLVPMEEYEEIQEINGKIVIFQRMVMALTEAYRILEMEFQDGSRHQTTVCSGCIGKVTREVAEELFTSDLERFEEEERRGLGDVPWAMFEGKQRIVSLKER